jgi:hypothetical protein
MEDDTLTCAIRKNVNENHPDYPAYIPYHPDHSFEIIKKIEEDENQKMVEVVFDGKPAITIFYDTSTPHQYISSDDNAICLWNAASLFGIAPKILDHSFCEQSKQLFFITYSQTFPFKTLSSFLDDLLGKVDPETFGEDDQTIKNVISMLIILFSKILLLLFKAHVHIEKWNFRYFLVEEEDEKIKDIKYTHFADEHTSSFQDDDLKRFKDEDGNIVDTGEIAISLNILHYFNRFFDAFREEIKSKPRQNSFLLFFLEKFVEIIKMKLKENPFHFAPSEFLEDESELNKNLVLSLRNFGNIIREFCGAYMKLDKDAFLKTRLSKYISMKVHRFILQINSSPRAMFNNFLHFSNCGRYALSSYTTKAKSPKMDEIPFNIRAKMAVIRIEKDETDYKQYIVYFNDKKARVIIKNTNNAEARDSVAPRIYAWHIASSYHLAPKILSYFFCGTWTTTESYIFVYEYDETVVTLKDYLNHIFLIDYTTLHRDNDAEYFSEMMKGYRILMLAYKKLTELNLTANVIFQSSQFVFSSIFVKLPKSPTPMIQFQFLESDPVNLREVGIVDITTFHLLKTEGKYSSQVGMDDGNDFLLDNRRSFLGKLEEYMKMVPSKNIFVLILESFVIELKENITHRGYSHQLKHAREEEISNYIRGILNCLKNITIKSLIAYGVPEHITQPISYLEV